MSTLTTAEIRMARIARPEIWGSTFVLLFHLQGLVEFFGASTLAYRSFLLGISGVVVFSTWRSAIDDGVTRALLGMLLFLLVTCGISAVLNESSMTAVALTAYRDVYFVLAAIAAIQIGRHLSGQQFYRLLIVIASIFLIVTCFKYLTIGVEEKHWIGTLSMTAGQLGVVYPSMFVPVFPYVAPLKGWLAAGILGLSTIVHEKRSVILVFPLLIFSALTLILLRDRLLGTLTLRQATIRIGLASAVSVGVFLLSLTSIPSLNPGQQGDGAGAIDLGYLQNYTKEYLTRGYESELNNDPSNVDKDTGIQVGRVRVFIELWRWSSQRSTAQQIFGSGPTTIDRSYLLGPNRADILYQVTGVRGPTTLFHQLLVERGWIGVLAFFAPLTIMVVWLLLDFIKLLMAKRRPSLAHWVAIWSLGVILLDLAGYSAISYLIPAGMVVFGVSVGQRKTSETI